MPSRYLRFSSPACSYATGWELPYPGENHAPADPPGRDGWASSLRSNIVTHSARSSARPLDHRPRQTTSRACRAASSAAAGLRASIRSRLGPGRCHERTRRSLLASGPTEPRGTWLHDIMREAYLHHALTSTDAAQTRNSTFISTDTATGGARALRDDGDRDPPCTARIPSMMRIYSKNRTTEGRPGQVQTFRGQDEQAP